MGSKNSIDAELQDNYPLVCVKITDFLCQTYLQILTEYEEKVN